MKHDIDLDWEKLMDQASWTASVYLHKAVKSIDEQFGKGFAFNNPGLVGSFLKAASTDFFTSAMGIAAQKLAASIALLEPKESDE